MKKKGKHKQLSQLILLPPDAQGGLVQYTDRLQVGCLVPARTRKIIFNDEWEKMRAPNVWWSQEIFLDGYGPAHSEIGLYRFRGKYPFKEFKVAQDVPHGGSVVCWGGVPIPDDLREADLAYWTSGFHDDFCPASDCYWENWSYIDDDDYDYDENGKLIKKKRKEKAVLIKPGQAGVYISNTAEDLKRFPEKFRYTYEPNKYAGRSSQKIVIVPVDEARGDVFVKVGGRKLVIKRKGSR